MDSAKFLLNRMVSTTKVEDFVGTPKFRKKAPRVTPAAEKTPARKQAKKGFGVFKS
jgi:hypothetical protein